MATDNADLIDEFCDSLWLEDGLSKNTLDAYRRDMRLFATWLQSQRSGVDGLLVVAGHDIEAYLAARHADSGKATSSNRRLSVIKRFYQMLVQRRRLTDDPSLKLASAKQPQRFVHTLSEIQVEALLDAPDLNTPWSLTRCRRWC